MTVRVVARDETRSSETPNGAMTTYASPTLGGTERLSLWMVEMHAGAKGPVHVFDSEQIWSVRNGRIRIEADRVVELDAGDSVVLPAGLTRQVTALADASVTVCGYGNASVSVPGESGPRGTPPWIA